MSSQNWFDRAQKVIPGGVNSPVRAFGSVGGTPPFIRSAKGAYLYDEDDKRYIDYVGSWGPMILGHGDPDVIQAVTEQAQQGLSYGAPTALEVELAECLCQLIPSLEKVRLVSSGTEATMSAIRLARGFTGRDDIIKFEGCYHGHADSLLVKAGSGALTFGSPSSPGVPADMTKHTLVGQYNDCENLTQLFAEHGHNIACIILEPIAGNMNFVRAEQKFIDHCRQLCDQYGALLIFDEVMTGFRVGLGGAQALYQITPDLSTFGKVIGGGMPVGAFGGRADIMAKLSPEGPVYQAGTLSGNPLATCAGLKTLEKIQTPGFYEALATKTQQLLSGLQAAMAALNIPLQVDSEGGMFGCFFSENTEINRFEHVMACNQNRFIAFFHHMLQQGIYLAPSAFEAGFVSSVHSDADIQATIRAAETFSEDSGL